MKHPSPEENGYGSGYLTPWVAENPAPRFLDAPPPLGSHAGAAGGRSGPLEAPPGRAKGLSGELHVQDAQAWAERKPRAKERACSTSPQSSLGSRGLRSSLRLHAGVLKLALSVVPQASRHTHCEQHPREGWPALPAGAGARSTGRGREPL